MCFFQRLEANFENLLGMELKSDLTLQFLSSVNNDLFFFFFVIGVGSEIKCIGATELNDTLYVSVRVTCMIKFNIKKTLRSGYLVLLERGKCLT